MEIVFIRHGEPEWIRDGLNVDNPPLTERGHRQAARMAEALRNEHFDEVLCSPLWRARQTASPLLAALGRDEAIDPWLEEIRNPIWHGTPQEIAEEAYREQRTRISSDRWTGLTGGEAMSAFVERIHLGCSAFLAERSVRRVPSDFSLWEIDRPDQKITVVAHAGTNSVAIAHLLGVSPVPWEFDRFVIGHASVSRVTSMEMGDGHTFCLTKLSDVEHLAADDRTG